MAKPDQRGVSLTLELGEIVHALEAPRLLADRQANEGWNDDREAIRAAHAIQASLTLVITRLELLVRTIQGGAGPALVAGQHNEAGGLERDLVLPVQAPGRRERSGV